MLKKTALLSLMLFIFAIITSACGSGGSGNCNFFGYPNTENPTTPAPETKTITLSKYKFNLDVGTTDKIIAYVNGIDRTKEVKFKPIKEDLLKKFTVASVEENGLITALKAGTSIVQVSYEDAESVTFTVTANDPTLPTLEVVKNEINLELGDDPSDIESIIVTLNGKDVTNEATFTSSDENVATVDENGNINIVGEGETQIIIHLDGANDQVVTIKVTLPELEINKDEINLQVGEEAEDQQKNTDDLTVKLRGEDKTEQAVYQSSDTNVATVDENGHITAVAEGEATITVSVDGAKKSEVKVKVYDPELHRIILQSNSLVSLQVGQTEQITILIKDQDKTAQAKYTIEDDTIASVSDTGLITALKEGTTKINVHLDDTEADIEITVDVYDPELHTLHYTTADIPTQTIDGQEYMIMYEGETGHITVLVAGEDKTLTGEYTSGNTTILTVENTEENPGLITAIKKGDTTITMHHDEALEGDVVVNVKVKEKPTLVTTELNIIQGYTGQIVINSVGGENITNKFTFTSANNSIATVDSNGLVTLIKEQNTTITATYNDGMRTITYQIPIKAEKTLTTNAGITATAFSATQTQDIIKILMDTGMISNENDVDNIVSIDTTNGLTQITITIDREDGTQVAVVAYENGEVKYIQTGTVQNNQVTVDVEHSNKNIVAQTDSNGNVTSTVITPGFYNANNQLIASWDTVVSWGWNYWTNWHWSVASQQSGHLYNISNSHPTLKNANKLVIPDGVTNLGYYAFQNCSIPIETIVFPNSYTEKNIGITMNGAGQPKNYTIRSDNPNFDSIDGVIYTEDHKEVVVCPTNKTNVNIINGVTQINPDSFVGNKSISIGPYDSGADIKIPNSVITLNTYCFGAMPNLIWVELWDGLKTNNGHSIANCGNLQSIYIPSSVTTITKVSDGVNYCDIVTNDTKAKLYCEPSSQPSGWATYWNGITAMPIASNTITTKPTTLAPITWGVSRSTYRNNNRYVNN